MDWWQVACAAFVGSAVLAGAAVREVRNERKRRGSLEIFEPLPPFSQDIDDEIERELKKREQQ